MTSIELLPRTSAYGDAFAHFIILECMRLASYYHREYRFTYLRTASDVEIDLIVECPGQPLLCIEIKSTDDITQKDLSAFNRLCEDMPNSIALCLSNDKYPKKIGNVTVLPWRQGLAVYFMNTQDSRKIS